MEKGIEVEINKKKYKVLLFVDRLRVGGIQILLRDLLKVFDKTKTEYELLTLDDGEVYDLEREITELGITIHKLQGIWVRKPQDYLRYCSAMNEFFREHRDYTVVHIHTGPKNYFILKYAQKYGIPIRIAHGHNTGYQTKSKSQQLLGDFFKSKIKKYATHYVACSDLAGKWMFGTSEVQIIANGIDMDQYQYRPEVRAAIRRELQIEDCFVIGHVGRFTEQKNHKLILEIFAELYRRDPKARLVLVGIGETLETMKEKAKILGIEERVQFLGFQSNVCDIVQAMDVFLMPSLYEGFPITAIEAQASGLLCVFSDTITREVGILEQVLYIPLESPAEQWVDAVETLYQDGRQIRAKCSQNLQKQELDIRDMARTLEEIYWS